MAKLVITCKGEKEKGIKKNASVLTWASGRRITPFIEVVKTGRERFGQVR